MKRYKKIVSALLVIVLIAVQIIPILNVKAEGVEFILSDTITKDDDPNSKLITNKVNVIVKNFDQDTQFVGYKIIDVFYNSQTNVVSYQFTDNFQEFLDSDETYKDLTIERYFELTSDNPDGSASTSVITTSTLNALLSKYLINGSRNGSITSTTAEVGVYAIEARSSQSIYGVMVANVVPTVNESGEWVINSPEVIAKKSGVSNETLTVTRQVIDIEKMVVTFDLEYRLTVPELPTNAKDLEEKRRFAFLVGMENLTLLPLELRNGENILTIDETGQVYNGDELIENILVSVSEGERGVAITDISKLSNRTFTANYTVDLPVDDIVFGQLGNVFRAVTFFTTSPYTSENYLGLTMVDTTAYVYAIGIQNLEKDTDNVYLNGADYEIYRSYDAETNTLSDKVNIDFATMEGGAVTAISETGKYYLKQVKAPSGYRLSKDIIEIDVNAGSVNEREDGIYFAVDYNERLWFLPSTGGAGTIIYTVIGLGIIIFSSIGIIYYRKKKQNNTKNK